MFNDLWTVLPVKDTIDFFLHLWNVLFYRLLHISRCVHIVKPFSDEVWKFNFVSTLFDNGFNMPVIIETRLQLVVYIFCNHNLFNVYILDKISVLHAKSLSSSCNEEPFI